MRVDGIMPVTQSKTVLLVEDNVLLCKCLAEMLGEAGWRVATTTSATAALDCVDAGGMPDVLVTDLWLGSGMNGLALIAEARRRWPQLRAVLISGADVGGLDMHPNDRFLGKPFSMDALIHVVMELNREPVAASRCTVCQP